MATALRYRTGFDRRTGEILTGWPECAQSLEIIWTTRRNTRIMLLDFGSDLRGLLAEDVTPVLALQLYNDLAGAAHRWEPEYRLDELQLVHLTEGGGLGLRHGGLYFPEGRLGNYDVAIPMTAKPKRFGIDLRGVSS
jgi:uncharacterized protein